jgi:2-keto-4-pentenoate hydratase
VQDEALARALLAARHGRPVPSDQVPRDLKQAYAVQRLVMDQLGDIGGWKVGAPGPDGPISCAPLPAATISRAPRSFDGRRYDGCEVESEICFRLGADLPAGGAYEGNQVLAAISTCHPGIEILQSRYAAPDEAGALAQLADLMQSGAYVWGDPIEGWRQIDFARTEVTQLIGEAHPKVAVGNPAGDMLRLLVWLANEGAAWAGGLRAGQIVTCGSWTGKTSMSAGATVTTTFDCAPAIVVSFV